MGGGASWKTFHQVGVWIFSGTTQLFVKVNMRQVGISRGMKGFNSKNLSKVQEVENGVNVLKFEKASLPAPIMEMGLLIDRCSSYTPP